MVPSHMQHSGEIVPQVLYQQVKALVADGFLTVFPCADESNQLYAADIEDLRHRLDELIGIGKQILSKLSEL